jgi:hypothetical protein
VLRVSGATTSGAWNPINDTTAAGGAALINPNLNASKLAAPPVPAQNYFDVTFTPQSGVAYHIWLRLRATNDSYQNDSVFLQFSSATDKTGSPLPKPGTSGAQVVSLEEGSSAGVSGWGWNDSNYGALAANVYFNAGTQTLRILQREDGVRIDQIVISSQKYLTARPGTTKNDATILPQ